MGEGFIGGLLQSNPLFVGIFSLLGTIVGGLISHYAGSARMRAANNFSVVAAVTQSQAQAFAYAAIYKFLADHPSERVIAIEDIKKAPELEKHLIVLFGAYHFMAYAAKKDLVDKEFIEEDFASTMTMMWGRFEQFVHHYRLTLDRPLLWEELEVFVKHQQRVRVKATSKDLKALALA